MGSSGGRSRYFLISAACYVCIVIYYFGSNFGAPVHLRVSDPATASSSSAEPSSSSGYSNRDLTSSTKAEMSSPPNLPSGGGSARSAAEAAFAEQLKKASSAEPESENIVIADHRDVTDKVTDVVKCRTDYGDLVIDVRASWAPLGSKQFVALVDAGFFTNMPFYRVCPKYMALTGKKYDYERNLTASGVKVIADDPSLQGVRDMDFGYVFFSAQGQNSRHHDVAFAFCEMANCAVTGLGKEAWEVPVGTTRKGYFGTLNKIMATGFPFPKLELQSMKGDGVDVNLMLSDENYLKDHFPDMAHIQWCRVLQRKTNFLREPQVDHPDSVQVGQRRVSEDAKKQQRLEKRAAMMGLADKPDSGDSSVVKAWKPSSLTQQKLQTNPAISVGSSKSGSNAGNVVGDKQEDKVDLGDASDPDNAPPAVLDESSPFRVEFVIISGKGDPQPFEEKIIVEINPAWAPNGAKRFRDLVKAKFFDGCAFFRAVKNFMYQFGIPPLATAKANPWARLPIPDDPVLHSNEPGTLTFAMAGKNTRGHQLYFNVKDNKYLDAQGFAAIGKIVEGYEKLQKVNTEYGEKPNQGKIHQQGNEYLDENFPRLTYIKSVKFI